MIRLNGRIIHLPLTAEFGGEELFYVLAARLVLSGAAVTPGKNNSLAGNYLS
jgi:hypothetical protein